jgi:hypothetical protein
MKYAPPHYSKLTSGFCVVDLGYYRDEAEFLTRVEEDAIAFKPQGDLIHAYTRPSPSASGKGKGIAALTPEDKDAVVYEVYHVCLSSSFVLMGEFYDSCLGYMANPWL